MIHCLLKPTRSFAATREYLKPTLLNTPIAVNGPFLSTSDQIRARGEFFEDLELA